MLDFIIITLIICVITLWFQSRPFFWRGKGIDWKIGLPIFGSTGGSLLKPWNEFWTEFYMKAGDKRILGFHHFSYPALLIKDPEWRKRVLITDADYFMAREFRLSDDDPISRSLFFTGSQLWKNQRTKMTPYFTPARIKAMVQFLHPITDRFVTYIGDESKKGPVDIQASSLKLATDVIMSNVFGLEPEAFENPNSFFYNLQKELVSFGLGVRALLGVLAPNISNLFGVTLLRQSTQEKLKGFVLDVISQRSKGVGVRPDFMQGMVELMEQGENKNGGVKDAKSHYENEFDRFTVLGQCMLMYMAGTETTGNSLSFLLYELSLNQEIQTKLREEINGMIKKTSGNYQLEDFNSLTYMNMVISETLRKYPIASVVGRKCTKAYNLDGLDIPVGTLIPIPIVAIHYDPVHYPEPTKFDPERFSSDATIVPGAYLPFGLGPRTCIGMKFAQVEIALGLVKLLPKYRLSLSNKTTLPVRFSPSPTLCSMKPLWLNVEPL